MIFQCPYCPRSFDREDSFRFHKYTHERIEELNLIIPRKLQRLHEEKENSKTCWWCGAIFHDDDELLRFHEGLHQSGSWEEEPSQGYTFRKVKERTFKKSKAIDHHYDIKIHSDIVRKKKKVHDVQDELAHLSDDTLQQATENLKQSDLERVIIHSDSLITPIVVPLRKIEEMSSGVILDHINHVLTSHEDINVDESSYLDIGTIQVPSG
jgi:hypothetical protein